MSKTQKVCFRETHFLPYQNTDSKTKTQILQSSGYIRVTARPRAGTFMPSGDTHRCSMIIK